MKHRRYPEAYLLPGTKIVNPPEGFRSSRDSKGNSYRSLLSQPDCYTNRKSISRFRTGYPCADILQMIEIVARNDYGGNTLSVDIQK